MIQFEEHMFEMVHLVGESSNMEARKTHTHIYIYTVYHFKLFPKKSRVEIYTTEIV